MNAWYERIKRFHDAGLWTVKMVGDGVLCRKITAEEYEEITGEKYEA